MSPRLNLIERAHVGPVVRPERAAGAQAGRADPIRAGRLSAPDPQAQRVREAGGPVDSAFYGCACGYRFRAPVSASVHCPHCGAAQDW